MIIDGEDWTDLISPELAPRLREILAGAASDFSSSSRSRSALEQRMILAEARLRLREALTLKPAQDAEALLAAWNEIVRDYFRAPWTFNVGDQPPAEPHEDSNTKLMQYLRTFLVPTLVLKAALLYYGLNYSSHPGEGYGTGLLICVILSLGNFAYFLWKTRNDPEER